MKLSWKPDLVLYIACGHTLGNIDNRTGNTDSSVSNKQMYLWHKTVTYQDYQTK